MSGMLFLSGGSLAQTVSSRFTITMDVSRHFVMFRAICIEIVAFFVRVFLVWLFVWMVLFGVVRISRWPTFFILW